MKRPKPPPEAGETRSTERRASAVRIDVVAVRAHAVAVLVVVVAIVDDDGDRPVVPGPVPSVPAPAPAAVATVAEMKTSTAVMTVRTTVRTVMMWTSRMRTGTVRRRHGPTSRSTTAASTMRVRQNARAATTRTHRTAAVRTSASSAAAARTTVAAAARMTASATAAWASRKPQDRNELSRSHLRPRTRTRRSANLLRVGHHVRTSLGHQDWRPTPEANGLSVFLVAIHNERDQLLGFFRIHRYISSSSYSTIKAPPTRQ